MEIDVVQALVQAGAIGIVLALLAWLVRPLLKSLMGNLDKMSQSYVGYVQAQVDVASAMRELCKQLNEVEQENRQRDERQDELLEKLARRLEELGGMFQGMQQQLQAHEGRAQKRHEQVMQHAAERHAEFMSALKSLNGKT